MNNKNLSNTIKELHRLFNYINRTFFDNELPSVILTIQSKGKTNSLGWFTPAKVWEQGEERKHEINISAESFRRGHAQLYDTMLHEMIHLYCHTNNIKDYSRGGTYHNKNFKKYSEQFGYYYKDDAYSKKYGWSFSTLKDETLEVLEKFDIDEDIFNINRIDVHALNSDGEEKKKKTNIIKWVCGCGQIVRSSKDGLRMLCLECETMFMKEEDMENLMDGDE